jgi:hypothetical protein
MSDSTRNDPNSSKERRAILANLRESLKTQRYPMARGAKPHPTWAKVPWASNKYHVPNLSQQQMGGPGGIIPPDWLTYNQPPNWLAYNRPPSYMAGGS